MADDRERDFEALGGEPVRVKPERTVDEIIGDMARAIDEVVAATSGVECPGCGQPIGGKGDEVTASSDGIEHKRDWHGNDIMTRLQRTGTVQHADGRLCVVADVDALFAKLMADGKPKRAVDTDGGLISDTRRTGRSYGKIHETDAGGGVTVATPETNLPGERAWRAFLTQHPGFDCLDIRIAFEEGWYAGQHRASPSTERTHLVAELLDMRDDRTNESGGDLWPEKACVAFVDRCIAVGRDIERGWGERDDRWSYTAEEIAEAEAKGIPLELNKSAAAAKRAEDERIQAAINEPVRMLPDGDPNETIEIDGQRFTNLPTGFTRLLLEAIERSPMLALGLKPEMGTPYLEAIAEPLPRQTATQAIEALKDAWSGDQTIRVNGRALLLTGLHIREPRYDALGNVTSCQVTIEAEAVTILGEPRREPRAPRELPP